MTSIVSEKGQITIPKTVRDRLGLDPGTVLRVEAEAGRLVAFKQVATDVFKKWRGRGQLPGKLGVDDYLKRARDAHSR